MADSDKKIVDHINDLFSYATSGVEPQRAKWRKNYKYWKGTNKIERPSYKDNLRVPLVFRYTNGLISMLTANNPKYIFMPQEESDIETADALQQIVGDYYWDKLKMSAVSEDLIWWAMAISGSSHLKWGIDRDTKEYYVKALNSFCCYPDPGAKTLEQLNFDIYASMWSLNDVKRSFERGKDLKPQKELARLFDDDDPILSPWARSSEKSENLIGVLDKSSVKMDYGRVMLFEVWERDTSTEKIPVDANVIMQEHEMVRAGQPIQIADENNHPEHIRAHTELANTILSSTDIPSNFAEIVIQHIQEHQNHPNAQDTKRLIYPRGKISYMANNVLLEPYQPAPFGLAKAKMDFIRNPLEYWGQTLGEYAQSLQDSVERRKRQIADHADRCANPREFYLPQSGYDPKMVKNVAGEQIPVTIPGGVWWEQTPTLNNYVFDDRIDSERTVEKIMGYPEILQGQKPAGDVSGVMVQELKESLAPELAKGVRHYEWALVESARGLIEMINQTESPTKLYTIMGEGFKPLRIQHDALNLGGEYDIRIMAGSTLPTSRMAKESKALQFFQGGLYDQEAALKYVDDPQAPEVLARMNMMKQMQQVIEQQQQMLEQMGQKIEHDQKQLEKNNGNPKR